MNRVFLNAEGITPMDKSMDRRNALQRCHWVHDASELEIDYHDNEWGVPCFDDRTLFEMLILEGGQAGLSWATILKKRANYRLAFEGFDPEKIARFDDRKIERLINNAGIVRNRLKIGAAITNAQAFLQVLEESDYFSDFIWQFVNGEPRTNHWKHHSEIPTSTPESECMSKALKQRGFKFVGSTICYAYMQAVGMVNDHTIDCFCYTPLLEKAGDWAN